MKTEIDDWLVWVQLKLFLFGPEQCTSAEVQCENAALHLSCPSKRLMCFRETQTCLGGQIPPGSRTFDVFLLV